MIRERLRRLALGVGALLTLGLLVWTPGDEGPDLGDRTVVRYWHVVSTENTLPNYVTLFNAAQDSIYVEATPIPWQEHEKKILTAILSGDPPDVFSQFVPVARWASRMALRPLDDLVARSGFDTRVIFPSLMEEVAWQDRLFGLPFWTASYAFFYSKDLFRAAGLDPEAPPETWEDVRRLSNALYRTDEQGRVLSVGYLPYFSGAHTGVLGNVSTAALQAWQLGTEYLNDDGTRVTMTTPEIVRAFQWTADFYREYDFESVQAFVGGLGTGEQHGFLRDKLAMVVLDMSFLDLIERHRPDMDFGVVPTPSFEGYPTASVAGSWWLGIPRGASEPEAAWSFMQFTVRKDIALAEIASRDDHLFPANIEAAMDSSFISSPMARVFVDQMNFAHSPTIVPLAHGVFWREFYGALERTVYGDGSAEENLRQAETLVQDALDRAVGYDDFVRSRIDFDDLR